jgi:hypothetical protein
MSAPCRHPADQYVSLLLLQVTDFDLILGVQPTGSLDYGGRHITIAKVTAPR